MFNEGDGIYVEFGVDQPDRRLHPGYILEADGTSCSIELADQPERIPAGGSLTLFFEVGGAFVSQTASLNAVLGHAPRAIIDVTSNGRPASAEHRTAFRVPVVNTELIARIGHEADCPVLDISSNGLSVIASERYEPDNILSVTLEFDGQQFSGTGSITSVRETWDRRMRYGIHCTTNKALRGTLARGLQTICMSIQREQLQRLRGAG